MNHPLGIEGKVLIDRTPICEQVAGRLADLIISGEIAAGTPLTEKVLAESFDVSRPTGKDSIRTLVRRSLLTQDKNHSAYVTAFTESDYQDLLLVRKVTEVAVIDTLLESPEFIDDSVYELASIDGDLAIREVITKDIHFHSRLASLTESPTIARVQDSHIHALHLGLNQLSKQPDASILSEHHGEILDGVQLTDKALAFQALKSHIAYFQSL